jgi:hypothetical protein
MNRLVLWRRLSETDFRAINGKASPYGRGGGAMHIALGVRSDAFPVDKFLNAGGQTEVSISAAADRSRAVVAPLQFSGNPGRRGGEWRIRDQFTHRHPAWTVSAGFPTKYAATNPPYVLVFKLGRSFAARFILERNIIEMGLNSIPRGILSSPTGIAQAPAEFCAALDILGSTLLDELHKQEKEEHPEAFDPKDISDGRKRIIGAVIRRLGQQAFRRKLISAYAGQCAVTRCTTLWVLEAAHITPYRGIRTNAVPNGLLLRADVHTLFDLALISIEPSKFVVRVSNLLEGSQYEKLDGKRPAFPTRSTLHPSPAALEAHYQLFQP